jgi:hypothetical protein
MPDLDLQTIRRRIEPGRLVLGSALELFIKAYGAAAALSVALSDAETTGGKLGDAVRAVPNLADKYHEARYVMDHREEIQAAVTYLNEHTLPQDELQRTADESLRTLDSIETTYDEVGAARDVLQLDGISGTFDNVREAIGHIGNAYDARPDLDSLQRLADVADQVEPFKQQVDVLIPVYYGNFFTLTDNFAGDEIVSTVVVMLLALAVAGVVSRVVGFWVRRGRPGIIAQLLLALGAKMFRPWYVSNVPWAITPPLYDAAREHVQAEILTDPANPLDEDARRALEEWFASRNEVRPARAGSSPGPRPH